eukprot:1809884-Pyramimonas_sp.AAC.1
MPAMWRTAHLSAVVEAPAAATTVGQSCGLWNGMLLKILAALWSACPQCAKSKDIERLVTLELNG